MILSFFFILFVFLLFNLHTPNFILLSLLPSFHPFILLFRISHTLQSFFTYLYLSFHHPISHLLNFSTYHYFAFFFYIYCIRPTLYHSNTITSSCLLFILYQITKFLLVDSWLNGALTFILLSILVLFTDLSILLTSIFFLLHTLHAHHPSCFPFHYTKMLSKKLTCMHIYI